MERDARELMEAAQQGDMDAFGELWTLYSDRLRRYLLLRVRRAEVEDIVADTFLRALGALHTWRWAGSSPLAWFMTISRNLVIDRYKSNERQRTRDHYGLRADQVADLVEQRRDHNPEQAALSAWEAAEVRDLVRRLPTDEQRQVVEMRFLLDRSITETSQAMHRAEGAVKALTYRATRHLAPRVIQKGLK